MIKPSGNKELDKATTVALKQLERKPMFVKTIKEYLAKKDIDASIINEAVEILKNHNVLNDSRTTTEYGEYYQKSKKLGKHQLKGKLISKGAPAEDVDNYLATLSSNDEHDNCTSLLSKKFKSPHLVDHQKAVRYLSYKGYSYDIIQDAIAAYTNNKDD